MLEAIAQGVAWVNVRAVSRASRVGRVTLLPEDFSMAGGEVTATMKLKRNVIEAKHAAVIEVSGGVCHVTSHHVTSHHVFEAAVHCPWVPTIWDRIMHSLHLGGLCRRDGWVPCTGVGACASCGRVEGPLSEKFAAFQPKIADMLSACLCAPRGCCAPGPSRACTLAA